MSVRAYRIIKIERAEQATFNMWHDDKVLDFIKEHNEYDIENNLNNDGGGMFEVSTDCLESLLTQTEIKLEDYQREAILSDIAFAKENGDDCILYECF